MTDKPNQPDKLMDISIEEPFSGAVLHMGDFHVTVKRDGTIKVHTGKVHTGEIPHSPAINSNNAPIITADNNTKHQVPVTITPPPETKTSPASTEEPEDTLQTHSMDVIVKDWDQEQTVQAQEPPQSTALATIPKYEIGQRCGVMGRDIYVGEWSTLLDENEGLRHYHVFMSDEDLMVLEKRILRSDVLTKSYELKAAINHLASDEPLGDGRTGIRMETMSDLNSALTINAYRGQWIMPPIEILLKNIFANAGHTDALDTFKASNETAYASLDYPGNTMYRNTVLFPTGSIRPEHTKSNVYVRPVRLEPVEGNWDRQKPKM